MNQTICDNCGKTANSGDKDVISGWMELQRRGSRRWFGTKLDRLKARGIWCNPECFSEWLRGKLGITLDQEAPND